MAQTGEAPEAIVTSRGLGAAATGAATNWKAGAATAIAGDPRRQRSSRAARRQRDPMRSKGLVDEGRQGPGQSQSWWTKRCDGY